MANRAPSNALVPLDSTLELLAKAGLLSRASHTTLRPPLVIADSDFEGHEGDGCQQVLDEPSVLFERRAESAGLQPPYTTLWPGRVSSDPTLPSCLAGPGGISPFTRPCGRATHTNRHALKEGGGWLECSSDDDEFERYHAEDEDDDDCSSSGGSTWDEPASVFHANALIDNEDANSPRSKQSVVTDKNASQATGNGPRESTTGGQAGSGSAAAPARAGTKRARAPSDIMSSDHDSQPSRSRRVRTEDRPRVILACPFYKWNPARYRGCRRILLTKISYVKQHILRSHRMPPHCQICNTLYQTDEQLRTHVRSMSCSRRPYSPPDGVTEDQIYQLRSRVNQKNSLEAQWYEVFDIIFPNAQRPASVHLDPELSQDLDEFVSYLTTNGPNIILEQIKFSDLLPRENPQDINIDILRMNLSSGFQEIYDRWYKNRATEEGSLPSSLPRPALSAPPETHMLRPSPHPHPPIPGPGSLNLSHQTAFAMGGSDELAPLRISRRSAHDGTQRGSPLVAQMPTPERSDHWPPQPSDRSAAAPRPQSPPPR